MFKNKAFMARALPILILGVFFMFFYSGLQNDHLNVITPFLTELGWDTAKVNNPVTAAGFVAIVFYLICGASMVKFGPVKFIVPCTLILGLATIGLGLTQTFDNYAFYAVCLFLVRLLVVPLQMGGFMLAANWFIKYRGRALGWITIGSPLFSIVGIGFLTWLVNSSGLSGGYGIFGGLVILLAILTAIFVKDTPETCGLHADGALTATSDEHDDETMTLKEVISESRAWKLIISYGLLQFVIMGMMSFMAMRYITLGGPELWVGQALGFLSLGAALGIPMSYVLGWIDDKLGSIKASLILCILYLFAVVPLAIMPEGGNTTLMLVWAFGVACMTGGMPTMHPCVTAYVYGRKKYQAANKWIMSIQAIIMAFTLPYMNIFFAEGSNPDYAYYGLLIMVGIAFVTILTMWKMPDANLADRDYGQK